MNFRLMSPIAKRPVPIRIDGIGSGSSAVSDRKLLPLLTSPKNTVTLSTCNAFIFAKATFDKMKVVAVPVPEKSGNAVPILFVANQGASVVVIVPVYGPELVILSAVARFVSVRLKFDVVGRVRAQPVGAPLLVPPQLPAGEQLTKYPPLMMVPALDAAFAR